MKTTIKVEIDCDGEYCGAACKGHNIKHYSAFVHDLLQGGKRPQCKYNDGYLEPDRRKLKLKRCPQCLAATVEE